MKVYVESQSQFHPYQFDRYRVEVGKAEARRPKWLCREHDCLCGYPFARTQWSVIGHPELSVEVTQDADGNVVIIVR